MTRIMKPALTLLAGLFLAFSVAPASASLIAPEWYFGSWNCNIDGRPARMIWRVVSDPRTTCSGDVCSTTSGLAIRGSFSDNGHPWVPLTRLGSSTRHLSLRHADGNPWRLNVTGPGRASGWTTWSGRRYPLSCWR